MVMLQGWVSYVIGNENYAIVVVYEYVHVQLGSRYMVLMEMSMVLSFAHRMFW